MISSEATTCMILGLIAVIKRLNHLTLFRAAERARHTDDVLMKKGMKGMQ